MSVFRPNILHDAHNDPLIVLKARELNDPLWLLFLIRHFTDNDAEIEKKKVRWTTRHFFLRVTQHRGWSYQKNEQVWPKDFLKFFRTKERTPKLFPSLKYVNIFLFVCFVVQSLGWTFGLRNNVIVHLLNWPRMSKSHYLSSTHPWHNRLLSKQKSSNMTSKVFSPSRGCILISRMDSRSLLKILISINVFLAVYLIHCMNSDGFRNAPCVVIMNATNSNIMVKSPLQNTVSLSFEALKWHHLIFFFMLLYRLMNQDLCSMRVINRKLFRLIP